MPESPFYEYEEEPDENEETEGGEDAADFESNPAILAFLDQEGAEFQAQREQFAAMYGFDHDCHCAQDYAEGKLAQVTQCYLSLTDDALDTSARLNWENQTLQGMVATLVKMNDSLIKTLEGADLGIDPDALLQEALLESFENEGGPVEADDTESAGQNDESI